VYKYSEDFPRNELFCLTTQLRRAAISVAANIAEGFKKRSKRDKRNFLTIAHGSLEECRYFMILSKDLNYGNNIDLQKNIEEVSKLIEAYSKAILNSET
jgi:four helix bundle protein